MRKIAFSIFLLLFAACAFVSGPGATSARAQDMPGVINVIVSGGEVEKGKECCTYLGVFMDELTARMKEKSGYPRETGVMISSVVPDGPAEKAGVEGNDICYLFDGIKVEDPAHLAKLVRERKAGDKVEIVIYREGKEKKLFAKLDTRSSLPTIKDEFGTYSVEDLSKIMSNVSKSAGKLYVQSLARGHLGMALVDLNDDLAPYFNVKKRDGVLVLSVEEDSPAADAGIKGGDVIVRVNGAAVGTAGEITKELSDLKKGDTVSLDVLRKGVKKSFELEADEVLGMNQIFVAPFEPSGIKIKKVPSLPVWGEEGKGEDEARKLKEEMKALKERLKDLEERLGNVEKKD